MASLTGPSSSSTIVSSSSSLIDPRASDDSIELIANGILEQMNKNLRCSHDILPQILNIRDLNPKNLKNYYEKYGQQFLSYLQYHRHVELIADVIDQVFIQLKAFGQVQDPLSKLVALAKYKLGEKGEPTVYAAAKCELQGVSTICITAISRLPFKREKKPPAVREHTFLLLGIEHREFEGLQRQHGDKIHNILKCLKHGILFDPYLNLVCPLNQMNSGKGLNFLSYLRAREIESVKDVFTRSKKEWQVIREEAKDIYIRIKNNLAQQFRETALTKMEMTIRKAVMSDILKELKRIFPDMPWKMHEEAGIIWIEGSEQEVGECDTILKHNGIKTNFIATELKKSKKKVSYHYQSFVTDLDLTKLRLLGFKSSSSTSSSDAPSTDASASATSPDADPLGVSSPNAISPAITSSDASSTDASASATFPDAAPLGVSSPNATSSAITSSDASSTDASAPATFPDAAEAVFSKNSPYNNKAVRISFHRVPARILTPDLTPALTPFPIPCLPDSPYLSNPITSKLPLRRLNSVQKNKISRFTDSTSSLPSLSTATPSRIAESTLSSSTQSTTSSRVRSSVSSLPVISTTTSSRAVESIPPVSRGPIFAFSRHSSPVPSQAVPPYDSIPGLALPQSRITGNERKEGKEAQSLPRI